MGFKQTSEGRVFFKGPDNDDAPVQKNGKISEPVMASDQTQMQILLLLKSLNTKLKETKQGSEEIKKQMAEYKATIKELEDKTVSQENNYIDLEQKLARKHTETSKKTERVELTVKEAQKKATAAEEQVKDALGKLEEAKGLVTAIEAKYKNEEKSLLELKSQIDETKKNDEKLIARQKFIEKQQKDQGEKMVNNVAAYVALTKRVSETETRQESLDNKIEEATAEFIKLDRKIDKALEDRARMLRKIERIENAVMETRDALNAKAMVLLTNQGAIGGVDIPRINDELLQTDPIALNRRLQEETLMPWWRRPLRLQAPTLAMLVIIVLLIGWVMGEARSPAPEKTEKNSSISAVETLPKVSLTGQNDIEQAIKESKNLTGYTAPETLPPPPDYSQSINDALQNEETKNNTITQTSELSDQEANTAPDYGIKIHKGTMDDAKKLETEKKEKSASQIETIDIKNEDEMLAVLEKDPEKLASRLNEIEPGSVPPAPVEQQKIEPAKSVSEVTKQEKDTQETAAVLDPVPTPPIKYDEAYKQALRARISPDPNLPEVAQKIEEKAYDGVPEAQHDMGAIYVTGHGSIKKDVGRAILWFEEAAKNGVANARYNLGVLYHQGIGVPVDIKRAMAFYAEAAAQGHPEAQYNLGIAHIEGIGVAYDPQKAAHYFEQAANNGITEAAYNLGLIYENGLLGETRPDDALKWYKASADKGSPEAKAALEQLAKSLGISLDDVNRIVERVGKAKQASAAPQALNQDKSSAEQKMVAEIQSELTRRGLYSGVIDGEIGPMTSNAIRAFQGSANLVESGEPSNELLDILKSYMQ